MSRELRICPGVGGRKCGAFLSSLDRDPHPTCPRCRGKICIKDMTCDFCVGWSPAQWELFAKKLTCTERKRSRPSGSVPPAPKTPPRARTSSEVTQPGTSSSSSSLPSEGQVRKGESRGAPSVAPREASSPPARPWSSGKGGSVSGRSSGASERASVSSAPSGAAEGEVARSQRTPPARAASSVASPSSLQHALRRDESRESSVIRSCLDPPVFPDLRIEEQGRIAEPALGRTAPVTGPVVLALALLTARGQAPEAGLVSFAVLPQAVTARLVAVFGPLLVASRSLSLSGRPVTILGSIPVSPRPLST